MTDSACRDCGTPLDRAAEPGGDGLCPVCRAAGVVALPAEGDAPPAPPPPPPTAQALFEPRTYRLHFTGTAGEYFRIWIVNTFLTIVTLGIYAAWAKVRTRRYFYACTRLAGQPFDYLARPQAILKGNLVVAAGALVYSLAGRVDEFAAGAALLLIFCAFPALAWKSLRFTAHNTAWRNVRFRFHGTLGRSYATYLLLPLALPFTLGLLLPYWEYARKRYFHEGIAFGTARSRFTGRPGPFYGAYAVALLLSLGAGALVAFAFAQLAVFTDYAAGGRHNAPFALFAGIGMMYVAFILVLTLMQQVVFARVTRHCYAETRIGGVGFSTGMRARDLVWIRLSNVLAIVLSLGMLTPWAKVRRARYVVESVRVHAQRDLGEFTAALAEEESAVGDAAVDFLDMDIGL